MQALDTSARQSLPSVIRWYNTILSHPHIAEFTGPITAAPAISSSSSSPAPHAATNGISHGQAARGGEASTSQSTSQSASQSGSKSASDAASDAHGQQQRQDKPKGKDAKGGKLAKNDVAKGQKKGGDKKDKPSQAPKGTLPSFSQHVQTYISFTG